MSEPNQPNFEQIIPTFENLPRIVKTGLEIIAKEENFENHSYECKSGANIGDGYMGIIVKIAIHGRKAGIDGVELTVLCKIQHLSKAMREFMKSFTAFEREVLLYKRFLKEIQKFQNEKGLSRDEGFYNYPKVYYADVNRDEQEAVIIMEDMRERGFALANKFKPLPIEHCEAVIHGLARLHALSFCLKAEKPQMYDEFRAYKCFLGDLVMKPQMLQVYKQHFGTCIDAVDNNEKLQMKLKDMHDNLIEVFTKLNEDGYDSEYAIIGHGDSWINNFLFNVDASTGKPLDLAFIDWQVSRYSSPIFDLTYFIYICTDKELRDVHLSRLLKEYYDTLSGLVVKLGHDPEKIFPYSEYENDWKKFGKFGLIMALAIVPFIVMPSEEFVAMDIDKKTEDLMANGKDFTEDEDMKKFLESSSVRVRDRIRDIVIDMYDLGYI